MPTNDKYAYWRARLADPSTPVLQTPQAGFYRLRRGKRSGWTPIAIFELYGVLVALVGENEFEPFTVWDQCWANATTEAEYRNKIAGGLYPDEFRVRGGRADETTTDAARAAPIGPLPKQRIDDGDHQD